jgi:hypothetical protein
MDCKQAEVLLSPYILGDLNDDPQRCRELQAHLRYCQDCAEMYEGFQEVIKFVRNHKAEFAQAFKNVRARERKGIVNVSKLMSNEPATTIEKSSRNYKPKMTVEDGDKDLCRRCPELAESTNKPKNLQLFHRIGAVAACLVIGVLTWMVFTNHSKQTLSQNIVSPQVATAPKLFMKVELVKPAGNIAINTDQAIIADKELKTLLINDKHRMVMNTGTVLTIEPTVEQSNIGCLVKLDSGQIYTHVEHDSGPFIVSTAHGKAVITGTTFDVKAIKDSTTLVVIEGMVSFESEEGIVNVAGGQKSEIVGQSAPSIPLSCNIDELTAWATGYKPNTALVQDRPNGIDLYLALPLGLDPIVLAETDYDYWVEQKRNWFEQEFPWIFQLKEALAKEGIEVDYPELLIQTGDIWQFVYVSNLPNRFCFPDFNSLLKAASAYDFDKEWLLANVRHAKYALIRQILSGSGCSGLEALEQWKECCESLQTPSEQDCQAWWRSFNANLYITETRSLIWFAVRNSRYNLTDKQCTEVLALLQEEVTAAYNSKNDLLCPLEEQESSCNGDKSESIKQIIESISVIYDCEKKLSAYSQKLSLME